MEGEFGTRSYFQVGDYIVCGLLILLSIAIGLYYALRGGGQRTAAEYILANRNMSAVPVTLSLLASLFSGGAMQGFPADTYYYGPMIIWTIVAFEIGYILCIIFFMPMYYRLGTASAYEYLELRFNHATKICGVFAFLLFSVLYMAVVTYTGCVAITAVTGINIEVAIAGLCAVCAVYTVIGGIRAVLWSDSLQMLLMFSTALAINIKCFIELGAANLWEIASKGGRTNFWNFSTDLTDFYNGWGFVFQTSFIGFIITNQYMVQRLVVCKSKAVAKTSLIGFGVGTLIFLSLVVLTGIALFAYYDGCDPKTLGYTTKNDQIVPYFIVDVFNGVPGVPGLLLSGIFSAALSTVSSVLNSTATLVGEHFVKPYWKGLKESTYAMVLKLIVVVASVVALGTAFLVPLIGDAMQVIITITGCTTGSLFALYLLGAFFPFCGSKGALSGFAVGIAVGATLSVGCIVYQVPPDTLPLSAEVCLNETYMHLDETTTALSTAETLLWNSSVTTMTIATSIASDRSNIPVIFSISKSLLANVTCITTILVALLATLVTGKNDSSKMDPRIVMWSFRREDVQKEVPMTISNVSQMEYQGNLDSCMSESKVDSANLNDKGRV